MGVVYTELTQLRDSLANSKQQSTDQLTTMLNTMGDKIANNLRQAAGPTANRISSDIRVMRSRLQVSVGVTTVPFAGSDAQSAQDEKRQNAYLITGNRVLVVQGRNRAIAKLKADLFPKQNTQNVVITMPTGAADAGVKAVMENPNDSA
jgi:hypothetical protein